MASRQDYINIALADLRTIRALLNVLENQLESPSPIAKVLSVNAAAAEWKATQLKLTVEELLKS